MKKIVKSSLILLVLCLFLVGCQKKDKDVDVVNVSNTKGKVAEKGNQNVNVKGSGTLKCKREGNAIDNLETDLSYTVTYQDGVMISIHSIEKVSGDSESALKQYYDAYNKIKENYKDIKYYDMTVTKDKNSVTNDTTINYDKVDVSKIIKIEGREGNIFDEDNKPILKKWITMGKKVGLTCEGVIE